MFFEADNNAKGISSKYETSFMVSSKLEAKIWGKGTYATSHVFRNMHECCSNATKFASDRDFPV